MSHKGIRSQAWLGLAWLFSPSIFLCGMHFYNKIIIFMPRRERGWGRYVHWPLHRTHSSRSNAKRRIANPIPIPRTIENPALDKPIPISAHNGIHYTQQQKQNGVWGDNVLHACACVCGSLCLCIVVEIIFIILHNFYMEKPAASAAEQAQKNELLQPGHKYLVYCSCCCMFILLYLMRFLNFSLP